LKRDQQALLVVLLVLTGEWIAYSGPETVIIKVTATAI